MRVVVYVTSLVLLATAHASVAIATAGPGDYTGPSPSDLPHDWELFADDTHKQCGKYALVFRNPDLREDAQEFIHAQGQFFIQFQVVGAGASEVTKLSFSFGATADPLYNNPAVNCNDNAPPSQAGNGTGGAYLYYYRSDFDPRDGFFVPILTNNVPDGEYGAAIHAYNEAGVEVARAWAKAIVDNCPGDTSAPKNCPGSTPEQVIEMDHTKPWPIILPGDGEQTNDVAGLTVEFGEPIETESLQVTLNAKPLNVTDWTPPARDDDVTPNNDDQDCPANAPYTCSRSIYGPGFQWLGTISPGDVIRVSAMDLNRNLVEKTVHFGVGTSGGTVDLQRPEVSINAVGEDTAAFKPGDFHIFNVRLDNVGGSEGHVNLLLNTSVADGLSARWQDAGGNDTTHVVVPAGGQVPLKVRVDTTASTPEAHYSVEAKLEYDVAGEQAYKSLSFQIHLDKTATGAHHQRHDTPNATTTPTNTTANATDAGGTPAFTTPLMVFAVGAAVLVVAVRRRT